MDIVFEYVVIERVPREGNPCDTMISLLTRRPILATAPAPKTLEKRVLHEFTFPPGAKIDNVEVLIRPFY